MEVGLWKGTSAFWLDIFQGPKAMFIFLMSEYQKTTPGNFGFTTLEVLSSFSHFIWGRDPQRISLTFFSFFPPIIFISWRLITLQYCSGFCHTLTWIHHGCACVAHPEPPSHLPPHPIPLGHPSAPAPSILYHASNLDWWFISHMIIHIFQSHSPISSCPRPLQ